ncbi:MAG: porin family protein [Hyphomonadaceae bacterium]|nr:porin family protein [Hyphomonadaceae bacterium]
MKRTLVSVSLFAAGLALPAVAQDTGFYGDVGYTYVMTDTDDADVDIGAITGHGGWEFSPNFAVEGEVSVGIQDDEVSVGGTNVDVSMNYLIGAFGRAQLPVGDQIVVFARAGLVNAEIEAEAGGFSESQSESGAGYGVGAEFMLDAVNGVRFDYTRYDIEDLEADALTLAYKRRF